MSTPRLTPAPRSEFPRPAHLHHLRPHVEGTQPVTEVRVAVELGGPLARSHTQLALLLLADVPNQLGLWGAQDRKSGFVWGTRMWRLHTREPWQTQGSPGYPGSEAGNGREEERRRV